MIESDDQCEVCEAHVGEANIVFTEDGDYSCYPCALGKLCVIPGVMLSWDDAFRIEIPDYSAISNEVFYADLPCCVPNPNPEKNYALLNRFAQLRDRAWKLWPCASCGGLNRVHLPRYLDRPADQHPDGYIIWKLVFECDVCGLASVR